MCLYVVASILWISRRDSWGRLAVELDCTFILGDGHPDRQCIHLPNAVDLLCRLSAVHRHLQVVHVEDLGSVTKSRLQRLDRWVDRQAEQEG